MNLLLDSTVLIDVLRERPSRRALLADLARRGEQLTTASINVGEVYSGLFPDEESRQSYYSLKCKSTRSQRRSPVPPDR